MLENFRANVLKCGGSKRKIIFAGIFFPQATLISSSLYELLNMEIFLLLEVVNREGICLQTLFLLSKCPKR